MLLRPTVKQKTAQGRRESRCVTEPSASPYQRGGHVAEGWKTFRGQVMIRLSTVTNVSSSPPPLASDLSRPMLPPAHLHRLKGAIIAACQHSPQAPLLEKRYCGRCRDKREHEELQEWERLIPECSRNAAELKGMKKCHHEGLKRTCKTENTQLWFNQIFLTICIWNVSFVCLWSNSVNYKCIMHISCYFKMWRSNTWK